MKRFLGLLFVILMMIATFASCDIEDAFDDLDKNVDKNSESVSESKNSESVTDSESESIGGSEETVETEENKDESEIV